jgi:outer membrane cobalamin receptor
VFTVGVEAQHQEIDAAFASIFGTTVVQRDAWVGAAYLAHDLTLGPATVVSTGLRYDAHSVYGGQFNPRLGLLHRLDDRTVLRLSVGRTFRGPTFLLLYFPGCSNPGLQPERAWSADAGLERTLAAGLTGRLVAFATEATELIQSGCPPLNVARATIVGGSAEVEGRLGPRVGLRANVSLTQARDQSGAPVIRIPDAAANLALHYTLSPTSTATLVLNYLGARPDLDPSTFPATPVTLPATLLVGLRYAVTTPLGTWQVGVDNLFDVAYEPVRGYPAPGRTVFVSLSSGF